MPIPVISDYLKRRQDDVARYHENRKTLPGLIQNHQDKIKRWNRLYWGMLPMWWIGKALHEYKHDPRVGRLGRYGRGISITAFGLGCYSMGIQDSTYFARDVDIFLSTPVHKSQE